MRIRRVEVRHTDKREVGPQQRQYIVRGLAAMLWATKHLSTGTKGTSRIPPPLLAKELEFFGPHHFYIFRDNLITENASVKMSKNSTRNTLAYCYLCTVRSSLN